MAEKIDAPNDCQFSGLISAMNRYSLIPLGKDNINDRCIVEITGEAGSGKSRLCHYFAIQTILPEKYGGQEKGCLFISTKAIPDEKLREFFEPMALNKGLNSNEINLMFKKLIYKHLDFANFDKLINSDFEHFIQENRIKTIIIDNVTSLCDQEFQKEQKYDYRERFTFMMNFFRLMNNLILKYNLFCFCVNEVRAVLGNNYNRASAFKPALGKTWENNIATRLILKKRKSNGVVNGRWIEVAFSNYLINQYFEFEITDNGIQFL